MDQQRPLPHNIDAERGLLGAIFIHNDFMFEVMEIVAASDFFEPAHGEIFKLMRDLIESNRSASPMTLLADMTQDRDIGGVRASEYLRMLYAEGIPGGVDQVKEVARGVADNALARRLISTARQLEADAYDRPPSMGAAYLRDKYDVEFGSLFPNLKEFGIRHISEYGDSVISRVDEGLRHDGEGGLEIGLVEIQNLIGPPLPGRVYSIAGAAGSGKSALVQQILETITRPTANPADQKVALWIQAEMEGEEVAGRSISSRTEISGERIERAMISDDEFGKMANAVGDLRGHSLYIDAGTSPTVARIRSKAIRMKRLRGLHALAIDHLLYVGKSNEKMSDVEAIGPNMREIKALSKDLAIPIFVLMPLKSSYTEGGDIRRPQMRDLTHPAAIDQNSDVILFVHRPEYILGRNEPPESDKNYGEWKAQTIEWEGRAEAILTKRRGGKGYGVRQLGFDGRRVTFSDNRYSGMRRNEDDGARLL